MTRRRIISISPMIEGLDPERGLISQRAAILVTERHIGCDTTYSPNLCGRFDTEEITRWKQGCRDGGMVVGRRFVKSRLKAGHDAWLTEARLEQNLLLVVSGRLPDEPQLIVRLLWLEECVPLRLELMPQTCCGSLLCLWMKSRK
jgi:hypothetical protein